MDANRSTHQVSDPDTYFNRPNLRRRRILSISALLLLIATWVFVPGVYRLRHGPVTVTRWTKKAGEVKATVGPGLKGWSNAKKISHHALHAIVAAEDGKFYQHRGFDFDEIKRSYEVNKKRKKYARGGSTISQQVVKMAFLSREKSLVRKAREAAGTAVMELILSKDQILEWYINLAEFGDNVYGLEAACWHYFKTKPELLSIEQAVHLALVLPSPNGWSRGLRNRTLTPFGHRRFAAILNRMRQSGYITRTQWFTAVTRGDFGRPIHGYTALIAAEKTDQALCPGNPGCPDVEDDATDDELETLTYPPPGNPAPEPGPAPATTPPVDAVPATPPAAAPAPTDAVTTPAPTPVPPAGPTAPVDEETDGADEEPEE